AALFRAGHHVFPGLSIGRGGPVRATKYRRRAVSRNNLMVAPQPATSICTCMVLACSVQPIRAACGWKCDERNLRCRRRSLGGRRAVVHSASAGFEITSFLEGDAFLTAARSR